MTNPTPVKTNHTTTYPAINPLLPALSSASKNILITGAGTGIGRATALSFAKSSASNIALLGRRTPQLEATAHLIETSYPATKTHIYPVDITDLPALQRVFKSYTTSIAGPIHTLIANAGIHPGYSTVSTLPNNHLSSSLTTNVLGTANTLQALTPHIPAEPDSTGYKARVIHVSSAVSHIQFPGASAYSVAKAAAAKLVEFYALENPDLWVLNLHPGVVETEWEGSGRLRADVDVSLPADFTVWAASPESSFLGSGRLIWVHWDVDELRELFDRYKSGEVKDGAEIMGGLPVHKNFTLGLLGWNGRV
ncbi:hypothetical protein PMZ80_009296 [Knufia obscura]|uniref:NAD(P)-binding protein n=1 Tax=Knufia obscura TaxID=1635080 RepID=A0ABR0RCG7_9EURO|nr:hypothetical protein PMZ80_009296 [Knufia obscura]